MNRFEQTRPDLKQHIAFCLPLTAFILLFVFFIRGVHSIESTTLSKQQESLETALSRSIAQCYAVEGFYPPSLSYLTEHYGLTYDSQIFLVDYEYYGNNLLPDITVIRKQN